MTGFGTEVQLRDLPPQQPGGRAAGVIRLKPGRRLEGLRARSRDGVGVRLVAVVSMLAHEVAIPFDDDGLILLDRVRPVVSNRGARSESADDAGMSA
jgi:hypothetical protein